MVDDENSTHHCALAAQDLSCWCVDQGKSLGHVEQTRPIPGAEELARADQHEALELAHGLNPTNNLKVLCAREDKQRDRPVSAHGG